MATPTGIAATARQAASGSALRVLPRRKTYTTSWDINSFMPAPGRGAPVPAPTAPRSRGADVRHAWIAAAAAMRFAGTAVWQPYGMGPAPE